MMNIDTSVLSKILLIQNMLEQLPDENTLLSFVCRGLEDIPGIEKAWYEEAVDCTDPEDIEKEQCRFFPVYINDKCFYIIKVSLHDQKIFTPYSPYISNLCYMIAVIFEEKRQKKIIQNHQAELENKVRERTEKLEKEIKERKLAEKKAVEERKRAENYLEVSEAMIVELDTHGNVVRINKRGCDLLGYDYTELIGANWVEQIILPEQKEVMQLYFNDLMDRNATPVEYYENLVLKKDGGQKYISWHNTVIDDNGEISGLLSSGIDITERKEAEDAIKKGLEEKEVLLKELYHRTRNNMQVIIGLLSMQSITINNPEIDKMVQDTNDRIMSMALVYRMLYESQNLTEIKLKDYIIELSRLLSGSYQVQETNISFVYDIEDIFVLIETAGPCGLIINELITNSYKYAFPGKSSGEIVIRVRKNEGDIIIDYSDNGVGVKKGFDFRNQQTLGLQLIHNICENQLSGTVDFESNNGLRCLIRFNVDRLIS